MDIGLSWSIWGTFHEWFFHRNSNSMRNWFSVTPLQGIMSLQSFVHATTAQLSSHVQKLIASLDDNVDDGRMKFPSNLSYDGESCSWKWAPEEFLSWWRHQMETFSALLAICAGNSPVPGEFPHKGQWRGALMFSLICAWINDWVNNREAGDLRRHRGHYDVNVMVLFVIECGWDFYM